MKNNVVAAIALALLLKDWENYYQEHKKLPEELLQSLYAIFGNVLVRAMEILDNGPIIQYETPNGTRKMLKIGSRNEQYTLFANLNFCHCDAFKYQVLHSKNQLTCKHILAGKLAQISQHVKVEIITDSQFADVLNCQCE